MNKQPLILMLLGKSGAGKGTQVNLLKERLGLSSIGSGDLLRARKQINDFTGNKLREIMDVGGIAPTAVIFKLWMDIFEDLKNKGGFNGIILDGSPRKIREAWMMEEALGWFEWNSRVKTILIDVSDEAVMSRISTRKICPKCGNIILFSEENPDVEVCPKCGEKLMKRPDDTIEGTKKRLEWFNEEVGQVIKYYEDSNRLIRVNGEQSVDAVFNDILKEIEKDDNN